MIIKIGPSISGKQASLLIEYLEQYFGLDYLRTTDFVSEPTEKRRHAVLYLRETPQLILFLADNRIRFQRTRRKS